MMLAGGRVCAGAPIAFGDGVEAAGSVDSKPVSRVIMADGGSAFMIASGGVSPHFLKMLSHSAATFLFSICSNRFFV